MLRISVNSQHPASGELKLIDFEYGGPNYRAFDIANHFNEWAGGTGLQPSAVVSSALLPLPLPPHSLSLTLSLSLSLPHARARAHTHTHTTHTHNTHTGTHTLT